MAHLRNGPLIIAASWAVVESELHVVSISIIVISNKKDEHMSKLGPDL